MHGRCLNIHGISKGYLWNVFGRSLNICRIYIYIYIYGVSSDYAWGIDGITDEYSLDICCISMGYRWEIYIVSAEYSLDVKEQLLIIHEASTARICMEHPWDADGMS